MLPRFHLSRPLPLQAGKKVRKVELRVLLEVHGGDKGLKLHLKLPLTPFPPLTSTNSTGRWEGQKGCVACFFKLTVLLEGYTTTKVWKLCLEMLPNYYNAFTSYIHYFYGPKRRSEVLNYVLLYVHGGDKRSNYH